MQKIKSTIQKMLPNQSVSMNSNFSHSTPFRIMQDQQNSFQVRMVLPNPSFTVLCCKGPFKLFQDQTYIKFTIKTQSYGGALSNAELLIQVLLKVKAKGVIVSIKSALHYRLAFELIFVPIPTTTHNLLERFAVFLFLNPDNKMYEQMHFT